MKTAEALYRYIKFIFTIFPYTRDNFSKKSGLSSLYGDRVCASRCNLEPRLQYLACEIAISFFPSFLLSVSYVVKEQ